MRTSGRRTNRAQTTSSVRRPRRTRLVAFAVAGTMLVAACSGNDDTGSSTTESTTAASSTAESTTTDADATTDPTSPTATTAPGTDGPPTNPGTLGARGLRLSQGQSTTEAAAPVALVQGAPLDDAAVQAVVDRLPEWVPQPELVEPFNWPAETLPAPRAGATVQVAFPSLQEVPPETVATGPLRVLRVQPEDAVDIAPFVTITFDQPMVPISTVGQLDEAAVPATISPEVPGRWQWIGTRTLRFDATSDLIDRLPMATDFTVEVPAGTMSATGGVLAEGVSFTFSTPPVTVLDLQPISESLPLTPVFVATFDQRIDPEAVLATVVVTADGEGHPVRLATNEEVAADPYASAVSGDDGRDDGRWLAFRPVEPFAPDAELSIEIGPNTPSAEGPIVSDSAESYSASTYAPLRVDEIACSYEPDCPPSSEIHIVLNNELDLTAFDPSTIRVEPPIAGVNVGAFGNTIVIRGATVGDTEYQVTVPSGLTDVYGQQLTEDKTGTVETGSSAPMLQQFNQPLITLDPLAPSPSLSVVTVNHSDLRIRAYTVEAEQWSEYIRYVSEATQGDRRSPADPSWPSVMDAVIDVEGDADRTTETAVDLSDALGDATGHLVVIVETTEQYSADSNEYWNNRPSIAWVQATTIGLDVTPDNDDLRVWATDLRNGAPRGDLAVTLLDEDGGSLGNAGTGTTDQDGLVTLPLTNDRASTLIATSGDETALIPSGYYGEGWQRYPPENAGVWYVFDDRQTYRPGETVSIKGWVRILAAEDGQLGGIDADATIDFVANDAQGNEIATGNVEVNPLGGFDFTVYIPAGVNLGGAYVQLTVLGDRELEFASHGHSFDVQEFRRPEFEVGTRPESEGPYLNNEPATVAVDANYYAGGPLGAAPVDWKVTTAAATYAPPGWDDFDFGVWTPWWYDDFHYSSFSGGSSEEYASDGGGCCGPVEESVVEFSGETDANGTHYLQIEPDGLAENVDGLPATVTAEATVTDVNRQAYASATSVLVHPAQYYVGLRSDRTFVREGEPLDLDVIVTDIDGAAVAGRAVQVSAGRTETVFENGQWIERLADVQDCEVTSGTEQVQCSFSTTIGGTYTISASVNDDNDRSSRTELTRWVSGGDSVPSRRVEQESLTIVPDTEQYEPGDTAELLVQSPIANGTGLLTIARNSVVSSTTFEVVDGSAVLQVPITDIDIPNLNISIEVVGASPRAADDGTALADGPPRPAFATGQLSLSISTASRALTVVATPSAEAVQPGKSTQVDVLVTDSAGTPVEGSEFAIVVVDEAVLALSDYQLGDPLATFYSELPYYWATQYGRSSIVLADPERLAATGGGDDVASTEMSDGFDESAPPATTVAEATPAGAPTADSAGEAAGGENKSSSTPIGVRTNFDALAVFEPEVTTDSTGHAVVDVPLPDNLTRYRVMVVAVAGEQQFGSAEANITARLPLMVRPSAPRFLNFGDTFELPVIVQNQTDAEMQVDVVLQADNLTLAGGAGQQVTVAPNDRVEVRFAVSASEAGTAKFRVAAVSGDNSDAATVELPVYTPATAEAFATYGVLDEGATVQPVAAPTDVIPQFGGLDITTSSTSLQTLTDAVLYISEYPYRSSDAMASRILAIASLRDVLEAFDVPGRLSPAALDSAVVADIDGLVNLQNGDGGFSYWEVGRPSDPYNTIQAAHALVVARDSGFDVPDATLETALFFLADVEQYIPAEYSEQARDTISAYALNVRMLAGDTDSGKATALFAERGEELSLDALAWLWPVIDDSDTSAEIEQIISNRAVDTAGAATFTNEVSDDAYLTLRSDRRTDGLILDALIAVRPDSDLIPKVVAGLLAGQRQGRWDNIQENSFILLALKRYFDTFENETPDFVARVWLGDRYAGEQPFVGRSTDRVQISIPTADLIEGGAADLTIAKDGPGRLYYRIGLRAAPADLNLQPLDRGFVVTRTYEAVDDPADVTLDADGTWHIRAGASVRVRLTMVAESARTHVALVDALPAGLEILNPALATTPDLPVDEESGDGDGDFGGHGYFWYTTWFDHQNLRDDRAEAFATYLQAGVYDYSYVARATTPGSFVVPPLRAEEMYAPETFGRGATDLVVVEG